MNKLQLISDRANGKIWKVEEEGKIYAYKEVYKGNPQLPLSGIAESYINYSKLQDKTGLVEVHKIETLPDKVCIWMEYLEGYRRIEMNDHDYVFISKIWKIVRNLIRQGVIDWDLSPINFMIKDRDIKMIDLDRLVKIDSWPDCPPDSHWQLTWFGSRLIKAFKWMAE